MKDKINSRLTAALASILAAREEDPSFMSDLAGVPFETLTRPDVYLPNEALIICLAQARKSLQEPDLARQVGREAVRRIFADQPARVLTLDSCRVHLPSSVVSILHQLMPLMNYRIESPERFQIAVETTSRGEYLHTHDHCRLIVGALEGVVEGAHCRVESMAESVCRVTVDRAVHADGSAYRLDDDGTIWRVSSVPGGHEQRYGKVGNGGEQLVDGKEWGADRCLYQLKYFNARPWWRRAWSLSLGRIGDFFRLLGVLDRSREIDEDSYRAVSRRWSKWVRWEDSYLLTKAKYLAYCGVLAMALIPLMGRLFGDLASEAFRLGLNLALTVLILAFGYLITRLQLDYSRALHRQSRDAQKFLQYSGVGVTIIRPDYTIEYANPLIVSNHGEIRGRKCHEALRWEMEPCSECYLSEVMTKADMVRHEKEYYDKNGRKRCFQINSSPVLDRDGRAVSMISVSTDVTERKELEREIVENRSELESSEAKYRNFTANAADAIVITDPEHRIVEANKKLGEMMGVASLGQYQGHDLFGVSLLAKEEKEKVRQILDGMVEDRSARAFETRLVRDDGEMVSVEIRSIPIVVNNAVAWVQSILRDVSERKEQELEKDLLLSISNAIKDAPDVEAMIGQALAGIISVLRVPVGAIFLRSDDGKHLKLAAQVGMSSETIRRLAMVASDGSAHDVASRSAVLKRPIIIGDMDTIKATEATKRRIRRIGISSIVSLPMLMENELQGVIYIASRERSYFNPRRINIIKQVANELAVGIARGRLRDLIRLKNRELVEKNRELELTGHQLLQSEKMASIGQLAAGVAHEINNPIGYINSNLHLLKDYRADLVRMFEAYRELENGVRVREDSNSIAWALERLESLDRAMPLQDMLGDLEDMINESIEGTERVAFIVKNLKEFSHPEVGKPQMADLHEAVESTLNIVWNELKYKCEVVKEYGDLPIVPCYLQELKQVFMNLLVNASQAIPEKGRITIRTYLEGETACVEIADTGVGMTDDQLPRIFDPFYTTKEVGKGTGLGLSISYSIVKKHRGELLARSEPGKGTTFTIRLPLSDQAEVQPADDSSAAPGEANVLRSDVG